MININLLFCILLALRTVLAVTIDLAYMGNTTQSSTLGELTSDRGVDGQINVCSQTFPNFHSLSWWVVDLIERFRITEVNFKAKAVFPGEDVVLHQLKLLLLNDFDSVTNPPTPTNESCWESPSDDGNDDYFENVLCHLNTRHQFVSLYLDGLCSLSVCLMKVFGHQENLTTEAYENNDTFTNTSIDSFATTSTTEKTASIEETRIFSKGSNFRFSHKVWIIPLCCSAVFLGICAFFMLRKSNLVTEYIEDSTYDNDRPSMKSKVTRVSNITEVVETQEKKASKVDKSARKSKRDRSKSKKQDKPSKSKKEEAIESKSKKDLKSKKEEESSVNGSQGSKKDDGKDPKKQRDNLKSK